MHLRPIRSDEDHADAIAEIERLWGASAGTLEGDRLDRLAALVDAYEGQRWPIEADAPDTMEARLPKSGT